MKCRLILILLISWQFSYAQNFVPVQKDMFKDSGAQAIAWADYDNDGDLDAAVSFKNRALRLYQNNNNSFVNVASLVGLSQEVIDTRSLSWGDYNQDGWLDLYVGYGRDSGKRNTLYKNLNGKFTDVSQETKANVLGTTRQVSWIDYDNDGDSDLYISMRDRANKLLRNDKGIFTDVSKPTGMADPRRSVASLWFDMDKDGDLDLYLPNQSGDRDGLYRNDGGKFVDIAAEQNIDFSRRPLTQGSVGVTIGDYDNDGDFDLFVGLYGPDVLYQNDGTGRFTDVAPQLKLNSKDKVVGVDWGDYDNDGQLDLYVVGYVVGVARGYDKLYHQENGKFVNRLPKSIQIQDGDHGVRWADYDQDGDLDIWIANRHKDGQHQLFRNDLKNKNNALHVMVLDQNGHYTRQGSEVRVYKANTNTLLGTRLVDTGGGYVSQNAMAVHFGLGVHTVVDVEVTFITAQGRVTQLVKNVNVKALSKPLVIQQK